MSSPILDVWFLGPSLLLLAESLMNRGMLPGTAVPPLPPGWEQAVDPASGKAGPVDSARHQPSNMKPTRHDPVVND